jgi:uncharacterized protein YkwD
MLRKSIATWVILILLSLVPSLLGIAKAQGGYDPTVQTQTLLYDEARTVYLGNLARRDNGVPPLRWNLQLTHAARWFSWDSTENRPSGFCGHQDTQGNWPAYRTSAFGYLGSAGAENAFCGYVTPEYAIQGWMNSPGHRANLLDPNSREIGVGYYRRDSDGRGYVTQDFGNDAVYAPAIIENEAVSTTNPNVNLYIYDRSTSGGFAGLSTATQMMVSNNVCFPGATWEPYTANKSWTLANGDGWREVFVKTRDKFNRSLTVSDTIYLGANLPLNELGAAQMSTTKSQVMIYNLNGGTLPQVQFSPGWLADDTSGTFNKWWGNGERVNDAAAWGGTAYRLYPGDGESFAWVYDTTFIKDTPMVAYFRLKVNNNTSSSEVARISIMGGGTEYGPLSLRGTDFTAANQYQEFALNFTFNTNPDDVFLIFQFWRSGTADVYVDAVSIFSAPQAITSPLTWSVPGSNYRGQGVWVRYTNGSQFSALSEAVTNPVTISGNVGVGGATLSYTDGSVKTVTADSSGNYSIHVLPGWSGTITPVRTGFPFSPVSKSYSNVQCSQTAQNYTNSWVGGVSITSNKNVVAVGRPHIGTEVASYDSFSAGSLTAYVPMLFKNAFANGGYDSALYIQNVDSTTATINIEYHDSTGALTCTTPDTIAPLASKGYWLPGLSASCLPDGWVGGAVITSNKNIVANGRPHIGAEVMTYDGFSSGSLTSHLPMLFKNAFANGGYDSAFYIQNVDPTNTAALNIQYFDSTGTLTCTVNTETIAPLAAKGYWLPGLSVDCLPDDWVGGVVITSDYPIVTVGRPHIGSQVTTYNGFSTGGTSSYIPMLFKNAYGGSYDAALYIQNLDALNTTNITIKYYDLAGALTCTVNGETVAPLSSKGYWLPALSAGCLPDGWIGGALVTSDVDIVAIGRPHIGAQVTTYNGFTSGSLKSYLPMLFKDAFGGSYDSAFYIQNTEASAATVITKFYDSSGVLICTRSDTLAAFSTLSLWLPSLTCTP